MGFLRFTPLHAPKEFTFRDPDTKRAFQGNSIADLCAQVRAYRKSNELAELDYLETVVENYLCRRPKNWGGCEPIGELKRGVYRTIRGGVALIQNLMFKSFVSQEVADQRAEICVACPLNVFPDKGPFIEWSDKLAEDSVGDRKSKLHNQLATCTGCGCPLRSKIWWNGKIKLRKREIERMKIANSKCWQLKEL